MFLKYRPRLTRLHWSSVRLRGSKATANNPVTITFRPPNSSIPTTETHRTLSGFRATFPGWTFQWNNINIAASEMDYSDFDPARIYEAQDWSRPIRREGLSHNQIVDKAFEEKSILGLERYLLQHSPGTQRRQPQPQNETRKDGWRYLTAGTDVAEWEGIWLGPDGRIYLLEAKHSIDADKLAKLDVKLQKTADFLNLDHSMLMLYVAGKYWGEYSSALASQLTFGIIQENGTDLTIIEPGPMALRGVQK